MCYIPSPCFHIAHALSSNPFSSICVIRYINNCSSFIRNIDFTGSTNDQHNIRLCLYDLQIIPQCLISECILIILRGSVGAVVLQICRIVLFHLQFHRCAWLKTGGDLIGPVVKVTFKALRCSCRSYCRRDVPDPRDRCQGIAHTFQCSHSDLRQIFFSPIRQHCLPLISASALPC